MPSIDVIYAPFMRLRPSPETLSVNGLLGVWKRRCFKGELLEETEAPSWDAVDSVPVEDLTRQEWLSRRRVS